jgi:hypothetical protein
MATKVLKSIKGKVVRITRLNECGNVVIGSCSTIVSSCFVSVTLSPEIEAGDEYLLKSAWGDLCVNEKDPDKIKWINVSIDFAEIDPDVMDIIANATPIVVAGDTIGSTMSSNTNSDAFAIEVWTKRVGGTCNAATPEWGYFVLPFIKNGRMDGDLTIENGTLTATFIGQAFGAPASWALDPYSGNPLGVSFPVGDLMGMSITTVQPPAATVGCVAYAPVS